MEIWLRGMRDDKVHCFKSNANGKLTIQTDDSTFAGDIIQSLAMYLGVRELSSEATFPKEETRMLEALERVKGKTFRGEKKIEYEMIFSKQSIFVFVLSVELYFVTLYFFIFNLI